MTGGTAAGSGLCESGRLVGSLLILVWCRLIVVVFIVAGAFLLLVWCFWGFVGPGKV